jgi:hypothetical protein
MGKHIEVLETISSPNNSDNIGVNSKLEYNTDRQWSDFDNRELPSKEAIAEAISGSTGTRDPTDVPFNNQNGEQQITVPDGYDFSNCKFFYGTGGNRFKEDSSRLEYDFVNSHVYAMGFGDTSAFIRFY